MRLQFYLLHQTLLMCIIRTYQLYYGHISYKQEEYEPVHYFTTRKCDRCCLSKSNLYASSIKLFEFLHSGNICPYQAFFDIDKLSHHLNIRSCQVFILRIASFVANQFLLVGCLLQLVVCHIFLLLYCLFLCFILKPFGCFFIPLVHTNVTHIAWTLNHIRINI